MGGGCAGVNSGESLGADLCSDIFYFLKGGDSHDNKMSMIVFTCVLVFLSLILVLILLGI